MGAVRRGSGRPTVYTTRDGQRVPGVTTILSRFKDSGGLIHWAWQAGIDGKDYRDVRNQAGSAGHVAHAMIEADIHGERFELPTCDALGLPATAKGEEQWEEIVSKAKHAFEQYREWRESTRLEIIATEVALVSDTYRYGGTLDAVGRLNGALVIPDWKTSNRIYSDYLVQVAAYRELWHEHHPVDNITRVHLLRVDKEADTFAHHSWGPDTLDKAWRMFALLREAYDLDTALRRAAA